MRRLLWCMFAVMILASTIVVAAPTNGEVAAAGMTLGVSWGNDVPEWAYDTATAIYDGCGELLDLPERFLGSGTGSVAFVAPASAAPAGLEMGVTGTGAAAGGTAVTAAGAVGLVAATIMGFGCGTIKVGSAIFGDPFGNPEAVTATGIETSGVGTCDEFGLEDIGGTACVGWTMPAGTTNWRFRTFVIQPPESSQTPIGTYSPVPAIGSDYSGWASSGADTVVRFDCKGGLEAHCGLVPNGYDSRDTKDQPEWADTLLGSSVIASPGGVAPYVGGLLDPEWADSGWMRRVGLEAWCKTPGGGDPVKVQTVYSDGYWDSAGGAVWPEQGCPEGQAMTRIRGIREWYKGGDSWVGSWQADRTVLDWSLDADVINNATSLQCWVDGLTSCPIWEQDPGDPDTERRLGGATGVIVPKTGGKVGTVVEDVIRESPWPDNEPSASTTTTTTSATTIPPPGDPENCVGAHCVGGPNTPPEGTEGALCFPSGWGWLNPVEWVLKPVKCALLWAFWDQTAADEISEFSRDNGWTSLVSDSSITPSAAAGPCIELDAQEICSSSILGVTAPPWVSTLLGAVIAFFGLFEVIGLFSRITRT